MRINYFTLLTVCTGIAFATAPISIDAVRTPQDFAAYQRGWYQDGETNPATHLTKFKSPDGNQIVHCAIPHQPCAETLYSSIKNVTVHKMRIEITAGESSQVVYYAMVDNNKKLAVVRETLKDAEATIQISANEVSCGYITERALALYALAAERLTIEQKKLKGDETLSYQVSIQLDIGIGEAEKKIADNLAPMVLAGPFAKNISIKDSCF